VAEIPTTFSSAHANEVCIMGKKDPRVDAYIARSADLAKPIVMRLRTLVHTACPDEAARLNEDGIRVAKTPGPPRKPLRMPADFARALEMNATARKTFEAFSPSHRREYIESITEARTDATREKRLQTSLEWLGEGKVRNWKYVPK
jgi:uncharacterized protein YdeI (YjbR/CyaY-like superfamily)